VRSGRDPGESNFIQQRLKLLHDGFGNSVTFVSTRVSKVSRSNGVQTNSFDNSDNHPLTNDEVLLCEELY
jgi:hypothetical protein